MSQSRKCPHSLFPLARLPILICQPLKRNPIACECIWLHIYTNIVFHLRRYRKMVMETVETILATLGASDIDQRLEELLIDGILYAFQEQTSDDTKVMLNGFGVVVNALGSRMKIYLPQVGGIIKVC